MSRRETARLVIAKAIRDAGEVGVAHGERDLRLYREDCAALSSSVRQWAIENGDNPALRIALCGWEGEHEMPEGWTAIAWRGADSDSRERIWFSRHCLDVAAQLELLEAGAAS